MKYIRTKDNIYGSEKWENHPTPSGKNVYYDINCNAPIIREDDVVGMADTIEELCDELVAIEHENERPYMSNNESMLYWLEKGWKPYALFGAIWTDKGLIYVAKMNDKGELELI